MRVSGYAPHALAAVTLLVVTVLYLLSHLSGGPTDAAVAAGHLRDAIEKDGYLCEVHELVTEDGYVLDIFRILNNVLVQHTTRKKPLLMMHGLMQNAGSWVEAGPGASLAYLLADAGHEVWLGTVRGSRYARRHLRLSPLQPTFWQFSFEDMALYDLPAQIDYIITHTNSDKINYISFSQGGMISLFMLSERPDYDTKIQMHVALAPPSRLFNTKSPVIMFMMKFTSFLSKVGFGSDGRELLGDLSLFGRISGYFYIRGFKNLYESMLSAIDSYNPGSLSDATLRKMADNFPDGTSLQNFAKYGALMEAYRLVNLQKVNNGHSAGMDLSPVINYRNVTLPTVIINGLNDHVVDVEDTRWLCDQLPNSRMHVVADPLWNHLDMTYSQHINTYLFPLVNGYLQTEQLNDHIS